MYQCVAPLKTNLQTSQGKKNVPLLCHPLRTSSILDSTVTEPFPNDTHDFVTKRYDVVRGFTLV